VCNARFSRPPPTQIYDIVCRTHLTLARRGRKLGEQIASQEHAPNVAVAGPRTTWVGVLERAALVIGRAPAEMGDELFGGGEAADVTGLGGDGGQ
jgi:hypothetical protein